MQGLYYGFNEIPVKKKKKCLYKMYGGKHEKNLKVTTHFFADARGQKQEASVLLSVPINCCVILFSPASELHLHYKTKFRVRTEVRGSHSRDVI